MRAQFIGLVFACCTLWLLSCNPNTSQSNQEEFNARFTKRKYLCLISYSNECPISKAYIKTISTLHKDFGDTVQFCLLDPGVGSRPITGMEHLVYRDDDRQICERYNVEVYPQVVVYNTFARKKLYSGKIDDRAVKLGEVAKVATKNYLRDVLLAVSKGEPVTVPSNQAIGCFIEPKNAVVE
jgi:hypothetical protein